MTLKTSKAYAVLTPATIDYYRGDSWPPIRIYGDIRQAAAAHTDPMQRLYRIYYTHTVQVGNETCATFEDAMFKAVEDPCVIDLEWEYVHNIGEGRCLDVAAEFLTTDVDKLHNYKLTCGGRIVTVTSAKVVEEYPLWKIVRVEEYDW